MQGESDLLQEAIEGIRSTREYVQSQAEAATYDATEAFARAISALNERQYELVTEIQLVKRQRLAALDNQARMLR